MKQVPENVLSAKPVVAEIDPFSRSPVAIPDSAQWIVDCAGHLADGVRDRVADQHEVVLPGLHLRHLLGMPGGGILCGEVGIAGDRCRARGADPAPRAQQETDGQITEHSSTVRGEHEDSRKGGDEPGFAAGAVGYWLAIVVSAE